MNEIATNSSAGTTRTAIVTAYPPAARPASRRLPVAAHVANGTIENIPSKAAVNSKAGPI